MKILCSFVIALLCGGSSLSAAQQWKDTIVVARDGSGDYRTLTEAMEGIRAFMDYKVTVLANTTRSAFRIAIQQAASKAWAASSMKRVPKRRPFSSR